jgi:hypothetical protein
LLGINFKKDYDEVISIIVMAVYTYGIYWAISKIGKKDAAGGLTVSGNYNNIVHVGRDLIGVTEDEFRGAIERRFERGRGPILARRSLDLIRPAQRELGAGVTGGGVSIDPETVAAAPSPNSQDVPEENESQDAYTDQPIVIHATDLDFNKSGWAGHLPGVWEKRLPMRLFPGIKPNELFGKKTVTGDVIVVSKRNLDGDYIPYLFHIIGVD